MQQRFAARNLSVQFSWVSFEECMPTTRCSMLCLHRAHIACCLMRASSNTIVLSVESMLRYIRGMADEESDMD